MNKPSGILKTVIVLFAAIAIMCGCSGADDAGQMEDESFQIEGIRPSVVRIIASENLPAYREGSFNYNDPFFRFVS